MLAERFTALAKEIMSEIGDLHVLPPEVQTVDDIDEYFYRRSEYLGGMAQVLLRLVTIQAVADSIRVCKSVGIRHE